MDRVRSIGVAAVAVAGAVAVPAALLPGEVAVAILGGALLLGVATMAVCLVMLRVVGRSRVPPQHGTVDVGGAPEPAVIFGVARGRLVLGAALLAATVPMALFMGGAPLIVGLAALDSGESGWGGFLLGQAAPAALFLGAGVYLLDRTLAAWRDLRRPAHVACTPTVLRLELPEHRDDIPWGDILSVQFSERRIAVAVVDGSQVWTRLGRRAGRNMRNHGFPIVASALGIDPDLLGQEMRRWLDPEPPS
ncbi:hypothetical protein DPM19_22685 [Actinomadura craniellae]|uniref:Uncharacterized protein n=1 Tax=Actinomadura craniellae TaxID=2231787 RepID=A0A365H1B5_9ACTN|nr:hypothetical protein [Actinomadura craniellae]RAY12829.1 hypothetical protein DPM19_22685 [Actinomadura craniellae]